MEFMIIRGEGEPPPNVASLLEHAQASFAELQRRYTVFRLHGKEATPEQMERHTKRCWRVLAARALRLRQVHCPHGRIEYRSIPYDVLQEHVRKTAEAWRMGEQADAIAAELDRSMRKQAGEPTE